MDIYYANHYSDGKPINSGSIIGEGNNGQNVNRFSNQNHLRNEKSGNNSQTGDSTSESGQQTARVNNKQQQTTGIQRRQSNGQASSDKPRSPRLCWICGSEQHLANA